VHHSSFREAKHHLPRAAISATRASAAVASVDPRIDGKLRFIALFVFAFPKIQIIFPNLFTNPL
jgi:hypothetical protein